jgi:NAD(P)-dependent dehydrogenase (short-subunit alcohol dehydrogenase family)
MKNSKIVLITGGCGRLGRILVKTLIQKGHIVLIIDNNTDYINDFSIKLKKKYPDSFFEFFNVSINDENNLETIFEKIIKKYSRIDAVINNAYPRNKNYGNHLMDVSYSDFCENVSLHLGGYFIVTKLICKYFCNQNRGNIINISSVYGVVPPDFNIYAETEMTMPVEYAAIKSAIIHLTKYFSKYFKGKNIRFNSISLGGLIDGQDKSFLRKYKDKCLNKGMLEPKDIVGTVVFLLDDSASEYINGQNLIVDDGFTL